MAQFPRAVVWIAGALFMLFVLATFGWTAYFTFNSAEGFERFGVVPALRITAALFGGVSITSWLLAAHFRRVGAYTTATEIFFYICFGISLSLMLMAGITGFFAGLF